MQIKKLKRLFYITRNDDLLLHAAAVKSEFSQIGIVLLDNEDVM